MRKLIFFILLFHNSNLLCQTDPCAGFSAYYQFADNFLAGNSYVGCTGDPLNFHPTGLFIQPVKWPDGSIIHFCWDNSQAITLASGSPSGCIDANTLYNCVWNAMCQ